MSVHWALRRAIHYALGDKCIQCGTSNQLDINHIKHDGTSIRAMWGLSGTPDTWSINGSLAYFYDILWGIVNGYKEVELLCRKCHIKHHKKFGYD